MNTNTLFEKAFENVYSFRINAYVEGDNLPALYAHEMKNYLEKKGYITDEQTLYDFVLNRSDTDRQAA